MGFLRKIAGLLAVGAVAAGIYFYTHPKEFKKFKAEAEQIIKKITGSDEKPAKITGIYSCSAGKVTEGPSLFGFSSGGMRDIHVCRINGNLVVTDGSPFFRVNASETERGFEFSVDGTHLVEGEGKVSGKQLDFAITRTGYLPEPFTIEYSCNYSRLCPGEKPEPKQKAEVAKPKKKDKEEKPFRAIFIRPCGGPDQRKPEKRGFYQTFGNNLKGQKKEPVTNVGGGTLNGVCKDLQKSGVTDVFVGFKVDHLGKGCGGRYGELLYDSKEYPDSRSSVLKKDAFDNKFDPVKALMNSCKGLNFHAWFPVFRDEKTIELVGERAKQYAEALLPVSGATVKYSKAFADPENEAVIEYQIALLKEIVKNYKVIGLNLDYIRYDESIEFEHEVFGQKVKLPGKLHMNPAAIEAFVKRVRAEFQNLIISADLMANPIKRILVGQDGVAKYVDLALLMTYTGFFRTLGEETYIEPWYLKVTNPKTKSIPILRGWICKISDGCTVNESAEDLIKLLGDGVTKAGKNWYGLFTYESLLNETGNQTLTELGL